MSKEEREICEFEMEFKKSFWDLSSLRSKRFQSSYCAKVRAEAKKIFFLLLPQLSRRTSRGNACYAG